MASPASRLRTRDAMPVQGASDTRVDWSELPLDALTLVFSKLGAIEVLMGAGLVCHSWLNAAKVPDLWRYVDMARHKMIEGVTVGSSLIPEVKKIDGDVLCAMAKVAVDRSCGQLEVFEGKQFVNDELLKYIGDRSPSLKGLGLVSCNGISNEGFTEVITKFPLLQDLLLLLCNNLSGRDVYEATGKACAQLRCFWLRNDWSSFTTEEGEALGVAAMHELRSLTLTRCDLTNDDLAVILDGCPHLELLSLPGCYNIVVDEALKAKCARIKTLKLPVFHAPEEDNYETFNSKDCDGDYWESD